jgi:hypothetical protein
MTLNAFLPATHREVGCGDGNVMENRGLQITNFPKQTHQVVENTGEVSGIGQNNPNFGTADARPHSSWVRQGRPRDRRRDAVEGRTGGREGAGKAHAVVTVTASVRRPLPRHYSLQEIQEGVAPRAVVKTKPESYRN